MKRTALTVGTFDGVHRGHQAIIHRVLQMARHTALASAVVTFPISPRFVLQRHKPPVILTEIEERQALLKRMGISHVHVLSFTRRLSTLSAEAFFQRYLLQRFNAGHLVVGYNFAFGQGRRGDVALLRRLGRATQVAVTQVTVLQRYRQPVSSQRIREILRAGAVERAAGFLGYPYSLAGTVVQGCGRGGQTGIPTANLSIHPHKLLPLGVFGVRATVEHQETPQLWLPKGWGIHAGAASEKPQEAWAGVCNVGWRPTFGRTQRPTVEVHLLGWHGRLVGRRLRIMFLCRLRSEQRFPTLAALQRQIGQDIALYRRRLPNVAAQLYRVQTIC